MLLLPLVHVLASPALAQDAELDQGIDAHGFRPAVSSGDPSDPLTLWRATNVAAKQVAGDAILEFAKEPLALYESDGTVTPVLDDVLALDVGGAVGLGHGVALTMQAPIYLRSNGWDFTTSTRDLNAVSLGDIRVAMPIRLLSNGAGGVALIPYGDVPSGRQGEFLGNSGMSGGTLVAADRWFGRFDVTGNVGFDAAKTVDVENLNGGSHALAAADVGWLATPRLGLHLEGVLQPAFNPNEVRWAESPGELRFTARGRPVNAAGWLGGAAVGVTPGASAAQYRFFLGGQLGTSPKKDTDGDGLVDKIDRCPTDPETVNQYLDEDGCPDQLGQVAVHVVDAETGAPIADADVTLGGQAWKTDATGLVAWKDVLPGTSLAGTVTAPHYLEGAVAGDVVEGSNDQTIQLTLLPGKVTIEAQDESGQPIDARIAFTGPTTAADVSLGADGTEVATLHAGAWNMLVTADGYAATHADVAVEAGGQALVDVSLKKAKVVVTKKEVAILEQIQFDFAKATIKPQSFDLLDEVAEVLRDNPQLTGIEVQGHTDSKGSDAYNLKLSQARVESVVKYLVDHGVQADRLVPKGYGESKPLVPNTTDANRATNRRVQFEITSVDGHAVGEADAPK